MRGELEAREEFRCRISMATEYILTSGEEQTEKIQLFNYLRICNYFRFTYKSINLHRNVFFGVNNCTTHNPE